MSVCMKIDNTEVYRDHFEPGIEIFYRSKVTAKIFKNDFTLAIFRSLRMFQM